MNVKHLLLVVGLASCAAEPPPREPLPPLELPGAAELERFVASVRDGSCEDLKARVPRLVAQLRALGPHEASGDAQRAVAERALGCEAPWAGRLLFRGLPALVQERLGMDAVRELFAFTKAPPHRAAMLGQLERWLEDPDGDHEGATSREVGAVEKLLAPSCAELAPVRPRAYAEALALWQQASCDVQPVLEAGLELSSELRADACLRIERSGKPVSGNRLVRAIVTDPGERLTEPGGTVKAGPILIPRADVTVGTRFLTHDRCTELALAAGGLVLHPARSTELAFTHYGQLRAVLVIRLDAEGREGPALAFGTAPPGVSEARRRQLEAAGPAVLERREREGEGARWRAVDAASLSGPPRGAVWRLRFDPDEKVAGGFWSGHADLRVVVLHEDGSAATATLGPDSVREPARLPRTKATIEHR